MSRLLTLEQIQNVDIRVPVENFFPFVVEYSTRQGGVFRLSSSQRASRSLPSDDCNVTHHDSWGSSE